MIFGLDIVYYLKEDNIYIKRIYEWENSEGYIYFYFFDNGYFNLDKVDYKIGNWFWICNDFYNLIDILS